VRAYTLKQEGEKQKLAAIDKADSEVDELVARAEPQGPIAVLAARKTGERIKRRQRKKRRQFELNTIPK